MEAFKSSDDLALASDLESDLCRRGGSVMANLLFSARPDFRKRLGDEKLLHFVRRFPNLFHIRPAQQGGHLICVCNHSNSETQDSSELIQLGSAMGCAEPGATLPENILVGNERERVVHASRQLEREVMRTLATAEQRILNSAESKTCRLETERVTSDVSYLLRNGRVRRKLVALIRVLPIPALIFLGWEYADEESDHRVPKEHCSGSDQKQALCRCPMTSGARTLAGYLMCFLRDRPTRFCIMERPCSPDVSGRLPYCYYDDSSCSCHFRVMLLKSSIVDEQADERLLQAIADRVIELSGAGNTWRVPLARIGRDHVVHKILAGRSLLQELESDADRRAAQGLAPRFTLTGAHASVFTIGITEYWLTKTLEREKAIGNAGQPAQRRRQQQEVTSSVPIDVLHNGAGVIAIQKVPGFTTECMLSALQVHLSAQGSSHRVVSVSRLDRDTSGVLVAATSFDAADHLTEQFKEHSVYKQYIALCSGRLMPREDKISARLFISGYADKYRAYVSPKGKEACTKYIVLQYFKRRSGSSESVAPTDFPVKASDDAMACNEELYQQIWSYCNTHANQEEQEQCEWYTLVACYPLTGRTHQIRAHLAWRGHSLVADANYASRGSARSQFRWCKRLWLHCQVMRLRDLSSRELEIQMPLPQDLRAAVLSLEPCGPREVDWHDWLGIKEAGEQDV